MALEICYVPGDADQDFEVDNELLEGPEALLIENYALGNREIIGLENNAASGGRINFFESEGVLEDLEVTELPVGLDWFDLPAPYSTIKLGVGDSQDIEFHDGDDAQGILRIRHVADTEITASLLVPEGLYFPDRPYIPSPNTDLD